MVSGFLNFINRVGIEWHLTVFGVYTEPITSEMKYLFTCLLDFLCISSLVKNGFVSSFPILVTLMYFNSLTVLALITNTELN